MSKRKSGFPRTLILTALLLCAAAFAAAAQGNVERGGTAPAPASADKGILVVTVDPSGPAARAGITRGDIILSADGKDLAGVRAFEQAILAHKPGDAMTLSLQHGDAQRTVTATLADRNGTPYLGVEPYGARALGAPPMMNRGFPRQGVPQTEPGAFVSTVTQGGPAYKAGIKAGDVILSVDGTAIGPQKDLKDLILSHKAGDTVTLSVRTPGQAARDVKVTLEKNPQADGPYLGVEYSLGFGGARGRIFPMMPGVNGGAGNGEVISGALIRAVSDNSPAARAGLQSQDIIIAIDGVPVSGPAAVTQAVASHKPGDSLTLTVYRFDQDKNVQVTVTLDKAPAGTPQAGAYLGVTLERFLGIETPGPGTRMRERQAQPQDQPPAAPSPVT